MAAESKITLTVVVSGTPHQVAINAHQKVSELMRKALQEARIHDVDLANWTLRFETGQTISPAERIAEAGISASQTLFLDPAEGGGGEVGDADEPASPVLVDPVISAEKLKRQLDDWEANLEIYEGRGWAILGRGELHVDVSFSARLPVTPFSDLVATPLAVRIDFHNYDVWAPSVRIIDPITRRWLEYPRLRAPDFENAEGGVPTDVFVNGHPETGHVFYCKPGVREYHTHPEHSGDDWLLYRGRGYGTLGQICESLWRLTTRTVTGLNVIAQRVELGGGTSSANQTIEIRQENIDELRAQFEPQGPGGIPAEIQDQLRALLENQG